MLGGYILYQLFQESGLPDGVVNFVPADGPTFGNAIISHRDLAGISFTGSSPTFRTLWKGVGENIENYRTYPRLVGETGGKNYHLVHPTACVESVINGTILSGFEYSGQKCSACSRIYVPESLADEFGVLNYTPGSNFKQPIFSPPGEGRRPSTDAFCKKA
eukprot:sb/3472839/